MIKVKYIKELATGNMTLDGYNYFVSLLKYYLNKYSWPKIILDERTNTNKSWTDDEILSFTQQFLIYVLEKKKLKNYGKIPDSYIEYYFKTIIVSYVANKVKEQQNKIGLSFDDTKRISLEILNDQYFSEKIKNNIYWNKENIFLTPQDNNESIKNFLSILPKISITEKTKHYKPRVKTALNDIFNLINKPIQQNVLIEQVFELFDQSSFIISNDEVQGENDIREKVALQAVSQIVNTIDSSEISIYLDYFFSDINNSLSNLAKKYKLPKSTVHYKTTQFAKIISEKFTPDNEQEGVWFLEKLHKTLDELK